MGVNFMVMGVVWALLHGDGCGVGVNFMVMGVVWALTSW